MYNHNYANDPGEIGNTQHNVAMAQNQNTTSKDDSQFRDTTKEQPSKDDELEEILSAMAFRCAGGITRSGRKEYTPAKAAIQAIIRTEQKKLLDNLEKKSTHYTPDGLVADGLDPWAVSVSTICDERNKLEAEL